MIRLTRFPAVRFAFPATAAVCAAFLGCAERGPERYPVFGTVTFDGAPVASGTMTFVPVAPNTGPGGVAKIENGKFDTAVEGGASPTGGPHRVTLQGFDGAADAANEKPLGNPVFSSYTVEIDLPKEPSEQTFDVPASAKIKAAPVGGGPA